MADNTYDAVIVGSGHNGLIVAAYLAKAGLDVCVLEKNPWIGGSTSTVKDVVAPGFTNDLTSTAHIMLQGNPLIANDELGLLSKYGLKYVAPGPDDWHSAYIFDDGTDMLMSQNVGKTCEQIAKFSRHDADAYQRFIQFTAPMLPMLSAGTYGSAPPIGQMFAQLGSTPQGQEFSRYLFMSAWDVLNEWFENDRVKMALGKYMSEEMTGPEEQNTGMFLLMMVPGSHGSPWAVPVGGSVALPNALRACIEDYGGKVLLDHEVTRITTDRGRVTGVTTRDGEHFTARRAVVANVDPRLSLRWLDTPIPDELDHKLDHIQDEQFSGLMQAFALEEAPVYKSSPEAGLCFATEPMTTDLQAFRQQYVDMKLGRIPTSSRPISAFVTTRLDPSRAPAGKHTLYLWSYVPYDLADGGHDRWDEIGAGVADDILDYYRGFTTNMGPENIIGRKVMTPNDYPKYNNNIIHGSIMGPAGYLSQMFSNRPVIGLGDFRTPVGGLYLTGQAMHPQGSVTGGGRATAQTVADDLGIDFDDLVVTPEPATV